MIANIQDLTEDFGLLDDWEDRYRYVIELGKTLAPLTPAEHNDENKVRGCASQVWLVAEANRNGETRLTFRGDSDALIVRGLIAIVLSLYSGKPAREIARLDPEPVFERVGPARAPHGAEIQRPELDGGPHPVRGARRARRG